MPQLHPDPSVDSLPNGDRLGEIYDAVVEVAAERLDGPVSTRLRTWEDGDVEVRVWHRYGAAEGPDLKGVVRYHTRDGLTGAIMRTDDQGEETLLEKWDIQPDDSTPAVLCEQRPESPA